MSDQVIGRIELLRPEAFNEVFNSLRKLACKNTYFRIEANTDLVRFVVGNPYDMLSEVTVQRNGLRHLPKFAVEEVDNFKVDMPFTAELNVLDLLAELNKFKDTDKVTIERIHPAGSVEGIFKDVVRLTINGLMQEYGLEGESRFPSIKDIVENIESREQEEPAKLVRLYYNRPHEGLAELGKEMKFLAKSYTEDGPRSIVSHMVIGKSDKTKNEGDFILATNGVSAYLRKLPIQSEHNYEIIIDRKMADALGSVMMNKKLFAEKKRPELNTDAWNEMKFKPWNCEHKLRNNQFNAAIYHAKKMDETERATNPMARYDHVVVLNFTANDPVAHFAVMLPQRIETEFLNVIYDVFKPCFEYWNLIKFPPKIAIEELLEKTARIGKGYRLEFANFLADSISVKVVNMKNAAEELGEFIIKNHSEGTIPATTELNLSLDLLRNAFAGLQLNGGDFICFYTKDFLGEKDGVVLFRHEGIDAYKDNLIVQMPVRC